ncbi:MAG: gliding motility-associated ABC transporter substrate-binding protein GldG [Bacteroidota bacterium]
MVNKKDIRKQNITQLLLGLVIIALINLIGHFYFTRIDLTAEKKYTLSKTTKELVKSFDDYVTFTVYLDGEFPSGFKKLKRETREMLNEFHAWNNNIQFEFIDPTTEVDEADRNNFYAELNRKGLEPTTIQTGDNTKQSQQVLFPGALVTYKSNREVAVNLLESRMNLNPDQQINLSLQELEYNLATALKMLSEPEKDNIAFLHGHGELSKRRLSGAETVLADFYDITHLTLENKIYSLIERISNDSAGSVQTQPRFKAVIIAQPTNAFTEKEKFIIDQYVMHGGKLLWLVDPVRTDMDSLQASPTTLAIPGDINLDDMFFSYGVRLNSNLIQDLRSAEIPLNTQPQGSQPQFEYFPWPYFPVMLPDNDHIIVKNLNGVKGEFTSTLDTISGNNIKKTILLKSSEYTKVLRMPHEISLRSIRPRYNAQDFPYDKQNVAVLLEGRFSSVFENRLPPTITQSKSMAYKSKSDTNQMIVVADGDVIKNAVSVRGDKPLPLGVDRYTGRKYGNEDFILNAVNYLCGDIGLLKVRDRELKNRGMDRTKVKDETLKWQLINVILPVILILIFSIVWNIFRRNKYHKKAKASTKSSKK